MSDSALFDLDPDGRPVVPDDVTLSARVPAELRAAYLELAAERGCTLSDLVRDALCAALPVRPIVYAQPGEAVVGPQHFDVRARHFDGATFDHAQDAERLTRQWERVRDLMLDGRPRTLSAIAQTLGLPEASVSARLRDLRKPRFGGYRVTANRVPGGRGLWTYRLETDS